MPEQPRTSEVTTANDPNLRRFRDALKILYPTTHAIHDPERVWTERELQQLEDIAFAVKGWK